MRIYFTTIVWLLTVSGELPLEVENDGAPLITPCNSSTVDQTAHTGDSVSFTCKYSQPDKNSIRQFCRRDGNFSCTNIISAQLSSYTKLSKISLRDDKERGLFEVNIAVVTQEDSGKYWCALKRDDFITCLQEVVLHVLNPVTVPTFAKKGESPPQPEQLTPPPTRVRTGHNRISRSDSGSTSEAPTPTPDGADEHHTTPDLLHGEGKNQKPPSGMIAGIVSGAVILVVLAIALILFRRKLCNRRGETSEPKINTIQSPEINDRDNQYEEIKMQNKEANTVCTLYSTVNPPADQLHYTSVNIHGADPTNSSDQNASAHPPAETTLYSTVAKIEE